MGVQERAKNRERIDKAKINKNQEKMFTDISKLAKVLERLAKLVEKELKKNGYGK